VRGPRAPPAGLSGHRCSLYVLFAFPSSVRRRKWRQLRRPSPFRDCAFRARQWPARSTLPRRWRSTRAGAGPINPIEARRSVPGSQMQGQPWRARWAKGVPERPPRGSHPRDRRVRRQYGLPTHMRLPRLSRSSRIRQGPERRRGARADPRRWGRQRLHDATNACATPSLSSTKGQVNHVRVKRRLICVPG
jgi:hypothetical protein